MRFKLLTVAKRLKLPPEFVLEYCKFAKVSEHIYNGYVIAQWLKSEKGKSKLEGFLFTVYENCEVNYTKTYPKYLNKLDKDITLTQCRVKVPRALNQMVKIQLANKEIITIRKDNTNFEIWCNDRLVHCNK